MRRMLPQKLIDYIKEVKNKIYFVNDGIGVKGALSIYSPTDDDFYTLFEVDEDGVLVASNTIDFTNNGLIIDQKTIDTIGNGLEVDETAIQVKAKTNGGIEVSSDGIELEAPIWKKMSGSFVYNQAEQYHELTLPNFIGTKAVIKYTINNVEHQFLILLTSASPVSFIVLSDGEDFSMNVAALLINTSSEDCHLDTNLQTESSIDCVIYYEDFIGPTFTI